MKTIYQKVYEVQRKCQVLKQEHTNEFGKFNYYDYTDVVVVLNPIFKDLGLIYYHTTNENSITTIIVDVESGEKIESTSNIKEVELRGMNAFQVYGSGISYLKKYHLTSMLGIATNEKSLDEIVEGKKPKKQLLTDERFKQAINSIKEGKYPKEDLINKFELTPKQTDYVNTL